MQQFSMHGMPDCALHLTCSNRACMGCLIVHFTPQMWNRQPSGSDLCRVHANLGLDACSSSFDMSSSGKPQAMKASMGVLACAAVQADKP